MKKGKFKLEGLVRKNVRQMKPYSSARDEFKDVNTELIFLDANENPFSNGVNRYPDPQQRELKKLLAIQRNIHANQILLGNGSDEVLDLIFRVFCIPGYDNIITLPPTYGMYKVLAETNDIQNKEILLNTDFQPDVPTIIESIDDKTKVIFFCSPNNPTGNLIRPEKIIEVLESFNGLVVIDEAYIDFAAAESWVLQLENYPNLIVTQTLSKAFGMAGIRLGVAYASEEIIAVLNKIKPPYNVNILTQERAFECLENLKSIHKQVDLLIQGRVQLKEALKNIPFISEVFISDANFVLCRVDDASNRYNQLIDKGIVVRNRSTQPLCDNTLRLTVGTNEENNQLITILKQL